MTTHLSVQKITGAARRTGSILRWSQRGKRHALCSDHASPITKSFRKKSTWCWERYPYAIAASAISVLVGFNDRIAPRPRLRRVLGAAPCCLPNRPPSRLFRVEIGDRINFTRGVRLERLTRTPISRSQAQPSKPYLKIYRKNESEPTPDYNAQKLSSISEIRTFKLHQIARTTAN